MPLQIPCVLVLGSTCGSELNIAFFAHSGVSLPPRATHENSTAAMARKLKKGDQAPYRPPLWLRRNQRAGPSTCATSPHPAPRGIWVTRRQFDTRID